MQGMEKVTSKGPAIRRFSSGDAVEYSYLVYGARRKSGNLTGLTTQVRLFRGQHEVFAGAVLPTTAVNEANGEAIIAGGTLRLGSSLPPGEYFLQVLATDKLAAPENQLSSQWIDFEIVE